MSKRDNMYMENKKKSGMKTDASMIFNVLIKKDEGIFVAHCLELDIVATSKDVETVTSDIIDLISAQVDYAFSNDNLDYLYRPAPSEAWQEFYACKEQMEKRVPVKTTFKDMIDKFVPPWITTRTCMSTGMQSCHA
jgi:hypothetical protein